MRLEPAYPRAVTPVSEVAVSLKPAGRGWHSACGPWRSCPRLLTQWIPSRRWGAYSAWMRVRCGVGFLYRMELGRSYAGRLVFIDELGANTSLGSPLR